ncbi:uncharacterized protein BXIN_1780 [Babesia sp. Xinjiang]|uniref:uncharacterized protein n=1 Tax=Babesia sp. Xinjiang TaxID=462227 RepID=UPI000A241BCB|nr:uncharacterized protein BXIN_1639 [Babesia sp. Xinjiang]XP_028871442.1 uncharacterized protein BXIN_1780 [Babesia sp. Xinjiang]ORM40877.1 hypothetical protein BXIN_1639 [Babesia sp. Xinjiang]ORM40986.1 hypothetical protein BXIN_1780 [Babesia sp. Xinjiang]
MQTPESTAQAVSKGEAIALEYIPGSGYSFPVVVGNQTITLKVVSGVEGIVLFDDGSSACQKATTNALCYDPRLSSTAIWCDNTEVCIPGKDDFECNEVKSSESINAATTTDFRSEGVAHHMETVEGYENISIRNASLFLPVTFERMPVKLAKNVTVGANLPVTKGAGGFFGLYGHSVSCRERSLWAEMLAKYQGFYTIDIYGDAVTDTVDPSEQVNSIRLGLDFVQKQDVMWAEKRQVGGIFTDASIEFSAYEMSMCGVNLFGKTSSYWQVAIDLTSQCLVLPKNFWFTLMAQLPVVEGCYLKESPKMCAIRLDGAKKLPMLTFKLRQMTDDLILSIPLQNLLLDNTDNPTLCIVPDEDTPVPPVFTDRPSIKFGYKVLEALQVVVDTNGYRVGFVHKQSADTANDICVKPVQCV